MPAILAGAILVANWLGKGRSVQAVSDVPAAPAAPVTVRIAVDRAAVAVGRPVVVTVSVVNHTNRTFAVSCSSGTWPVAVLAGVGAPSRGIALRAPCPVAGLPRGLSQFSVSLSTAQLRLPGGSYRLRVEGPGLPAGSTLPPPVPVTITAP